jgi:hypothetical protein
VSGSINLSNAAGKLDAVTVSGDARLQLGEVSEVRGRTTSGTFELRGQLAVDGRVDVEAVSGDISLRLTSAGGYSTEIESFSGDITGCLATSVERVSKYGPGTQLMIRTVESGARVRAKTLSGDIEVCNKYRAVAALRPRTLGPMPAAWSPRALKWISWVLRTHVLVLLGIAILVLLVDNGFKRASRPSARPPPAGSSRWSATST